MKSTTIFHVLFAVVAASVLIYGCSQLTGPNSSQKNPKTNLPQSEQQVETAANSFSASLFGNVAAQEAGKNFFISPLSVSMALAMTLNGANGQTYSDMQKTLGLDGLTNDEINESYRDLITMFSNLDQNVKFNIANCIWYRNTFQVIDTFLMIDSTYYDAEVKPLNFNDPNAAQTINSWINDKTNGKIPSVIDPPIDPQTVMFLINALYFNGTWKYEFDSSKMADKPFYLLGGARENVPTMMVHDTLMKYYSDSTFSVAELPYGNGDYSMLVILPEASLSFENAEALLTQNEVNNIINGLSPHDVQLSIPRFKIEYKALMNDILSNMGMRIAFTDGADFSRISTEYKLLISKVIHQTYIDVNEKGTEAAAVTVVEIGYTVAFPPENGPIIFNVNRPFIFLIKENHNSTIMFMGAVVDPATN